MRMVNVKYSGQPFAHLPHLITRRGGFRRPPSERCSPPTR